MPSAAYPFYQSFALTLVLVAIAAILGRLARRRPHVATATVAGVSLCYTIYLAEKLGGVVTIPRRLLVIHLVFANLAALAFIVVVVSGVRLFRSEEARRRRWHRAAVIAFIALTVLSAGTGTHMLTHATSR